jgi:hypothetical protein
VSDAFQFMSLVQSGTTPECITVRVHAGPREHSRPPRGSANRDNGVGLARLRGADLLLELATSINYWLSWSFGLIEARAGNRGDAMKVGISLTSNHPDANDPRQGARWMIERTAAAHRAGLDSLFVGDQHVSPTPYYQNTPMLGRLLAEWGKAPAGCLFLLPLWHPVLVAEQIGTLAAIAQGPFIMQCGLGWGESRFAAMGANIKTRPSAFEEALDIVRRLLAGETVNSSRRFQVTKASLALRPAEPVEVWIGASAPLAIDRAARLAEGWIASPASLGRRRAPRLISIVSDVRLTARGQLQLRCDATSTSASHRLKRKRCCSSR